MFSVKDFRVLSLGRTVVFGGQYHFFFEGHSKCMMKMKCGDKTAPVDIAVAICPGSNQISVAFGKKMHSVLLVHQKFSMLLRRFVVSVTVEPFLPAVFLFHCSH
ncbi:hypothetical protein WUBG_05461 [Wuchereria bancrofti]|uniref:Uncharacterized protein n=1 Tax=Wuchereria bancrofti TaxID=6293 RepID=J9F8F1_WUCBA|nr:hypothetical protein WUBG_05461 [Wuchereria bancrofti]